MGLPLNLAYRDRRLVQSERSGEPYVLPPFVQNDNTPLTLTILDATGSSTNGNFTKRAPAAYTARIGLYSESGLQLAFQNAFTADPQNGTYAANLTANSANQTTALGSAKAIDAYLEIEISADGGINYETVLPRSRGKTTLEVEQITPSSASTPPNTTVLTVDNFEAVLAEKLKRGFILSNETTGEKRFIYLDDNGSLQASPIPE